jgi:hypothetical protein
VQDLRERRRRYAVRNNAKIIPVDARIFFPLPPAQLIDAMPASHFANPRAKWVLGIFLLENGVQFQEHLGCGIFGVLWAVKKAATDLQNMMVVGNVNGAQDFRTRIQRLIQGRAQTAVFEKH